MADYMIKGETLTNIANAIRAKSGSSATMTPEQMSTEIENISVGGGDIDALIEGSITEVTSNVTSINSYAFTNIRELTSVCLPNATIIKNHAFNDCRKLTNVYLPSVTSIDQLVFGSCQKLTKLCLPSLIDTYSNAYGYSGIKCLVLPSTAVVIFKGTSSAFVNTPIANGTGYIYVPNNLVADYRIATNWSAFASQIMPWVATVEELANIDTATYTRACVGTENNGTEYTYNGTSWEVVA